MTTWTITKTGWLVCGVHRVRLEAVESMELRGNLVILRHVGNELVIACNEAGEPEGTTKPSNAKAGELLAALDLHFTPPDTPTP